MDDLVALLKASHTTEDRTPLHAVADLLIERGDGRGEILNRWLGTNTPSWETVGADRIGGSVKGGPKQPYHFTPLTEATSDSEALGIGHLVVVGERKDGTRLPVFRIYLGKTIGGGDRLKASVAVSHEDARNVADTLPDAETVHTYLDHNFGPDPRKQFEKDMNAALRPNTD